MAAAGEREPLGGVAPCRATSPEEISSMPSNTRVDEELASLTRPQAHPQHPYLRIGYSPSSRYPAADFTPWIAGKLTTGQFEDIGYLLTRITEANPGLGVASSHWDSLAASLCKIDLRSALRFQDEQGYLDLHAALIAYATHGALDGFMIIGREVEYLTRAIAPYSFEVLHLESKVAAANAFIKRMRRETRDASTAWTDFPLYDKEVLARALEADAPAPALRGTLKQAAIGSRQMFFGTLKEGPGQGGWEARPFGINEELASSELAQLGLGQLVSDPQLILMTFKKDELLAALEGHETKQGLSKKYIIKYIMDHAPNVAGRLTAGRSVLNLLPEIKEQGAILSAWVDAIKHPLAVSVAFR
jgi:hypothetical protein